MNVILLAVFALAAIIQVSTAVQCPPVNEALVTLLPNPANCKTYYSCNNGVAFLMACPPELYFNPELKVCDWTIRDESNNCSGDVISDETSPSALNN